MQRPCDAETTGESSKFKETETFAIGRVMGTEVGGQSQEERGITGASPCKHKSWLGGETKR